MITNSQIESKRMKCGEPINCVFFASNESMNESAIIKLKMYHLFISRLGSLFIHANFNLILCLFSMCNFYRISTTKSSRQRCV